MNENKTNDYNDIINMPHHVSSRHPRMSPLDRAAQFSPFAALTGHGAAIKETERLTDERVELDENRIEMLNMRLQILKECLAEKPMVDITYFIPDEKKSGGSYENVTGTVRKIDEYEHKIVLDNGLNIQIKDLVAIEGRIFNEILE